MTRLTMELKCRRPDRAISGTRKYFTEWRLWPLPKGDRTACDMVYARNDQTWQLYSQLAADRRYEIWYYFDTQANWLTKVKLTDGRVMVCSCAQVDNQEHG